MTHSEKVAKQEYSVLEKRDTAVATGMLMRKAIRTDFEVAKTINVSQFDWRRFLETVVP